MGVQIHNLSLSSLIILIISAASLQLLAESKTFWADIEALKEFKNSLNPDSVSPGSCVSSWDFTLDPCDNLFSDRFTCGFRCEPVDNSSSASRLTELTLDQAAYSGSLSSLSWNFPYLQTLDLSNNFFSGSIPDSLSNLTRLSRLGLSANSFSGAIPGSIGSLSNLQELFLDNNRLDGAIPPSLNGLAQLKRLELQGNRLGGEFPELVSLQSLYYLDVSNNAISGGVPINFPPSLLQISMRNNSLEGSIPENIKQLGFLQVLDLSHNHLGGAVPAHLFNHPSLQQLTLSFNQFTSVQSPVSLSPGTHSELIALDLSNNDLRGMLPPFMAAMPKLSALTLENNKFTGMIPTQYAFKVAVPGPGVSAFDRLLLGGNYLFGPIPGPLLRLKPGSANVGLGDNCLYRCPRVFFFCQGGDQKSFHECRSFGPMIP
ncbi:LRR receptor-like serine/threonine-protein kinase ERECTA [Pyrus communis]|uniref:LRR receptor-like serine/threonine-protein kinase ERECTA n=1 Tax=Pyrus communis TaxID=23211 RepID=UPI0035BFCADE